VIAPAADITHDIPTALEFIAALFDPGDIMEFRCLHPTERAWQRWCYAGDVGPLMTELAALNHRGRNIYVGANPRRDFDLDRDENVPLARSLFADFDGGATVDGALARVSAAGLPHPSIVISSGHGAHVYWLLGEPISDLPVWTKYQKALVTLLNSDPVIHNPERIMRVPGFQNLKPPPAPCTLHELDGRRYEWSEILPLIPIPTNGQHHEPAPSIDGDIFEGHRSTTLTSLAGTMRRRGMSEPAILAALLAENSSRCRPPLDAAEVQGIAQSVAKYPPGRPPEDEPLQPLEAVGAGKLLIDYPELRPPLIDGILRMTETCNSIAAAKVGKTHAAIDLGLSVCTGRAWLGRFRIVNPGPVLYVDAELHPNTTARRIAAICSARGIFTNEIDGKFDVLNLRGKLRNIFQLMPWFIEHASKKYRLIVLDALYRLIPEGIDENSNSDMTRVFNVVDQIADATGAAILAIHHASKGVQASKAVVDVGSGASAAARATDSHLIYRQHEEDGCVVMELAARSWPPLSPVVLRWTYPTWDIDEKLDPTLLRTENRRKRAEEKAGGEAKPEPFAWTAEKFTASFVGGEPRTEAMILSAADVSGLSERRAKRLLSTAVDTALVYRWVYQDRKRPHRFATIEQPVTLTNDGGVP
jgi:hypothetical protein